MKKFFAVLMILALLCFSLPVFAAAEAESNPFWLTHYNDPFVEGAGVVFTEPYSGAVWWLHIQFTAVEGEDGVYEITAMSNGYAEGNGTALPLPENGFVWAINAGNDYKSINNNPNDVDYTSDACNAMYLHASSWGIGDRFTFTGLDLDGLTVPTDTKGVNWYDDSYVCTATFTKLEEEGGSDVTEDASEAVSEEESQDVSEAVSEEESSKPVESTPDAASDADSDAASNADSDTDDADEGGIPSWVWIAGAGVVVVAAAVVIILVSKKK